MNGTAFRPGTTKGEAAWLISRALGALAPMAPAVFGKQTLTGSLQMDMGAWLGAACSLAIMIDEQAEKLTDPLAGMESGVEQ